MKKTFVLCAILASLVAFLSFSTGQQAGASYQSSLFDSIRSLYARPVSEWPKPFVDDSISYVEMGPLPPSPVAADPANAKMIELGKSLFFDPRLSGSNQISCATCHEPELGWTNGRTTGIGHDHLAGSRNVPSLFNIWNSKTLFWDGRSPSLEMQVMAPLSNEREMHELPGALEEELYKIKYYREHFRDVFGSEKIGLRQVAEALAVYERSITSRRAAFDLFLEGKYSALSDQQVMGLHLFRTKARCMNCHNGPLLTDNSFHNIGLTYYGRKYEDLGRYTVTRKKEDVGRFKTPSLRDVALTRPWMHNGLFDDLEGIVNLYDAGGARPKPRPEQVGDTLFPQTSPILKPLGLTKEEKLALVSFLQAISSNTSYRVPRPVMQE